jgi:urease accessory protein UreF
MIFFSPEVVSDIERVREFLDVKNPEAAKRALRANLASAWHETQYTRLFRS